MKFDNIDVCGIIKNINLIPNKRFSDIWSLFDPGKFNIH